MQSLEALPSFTGFCLSTDIPLLLLIRSGTSQKGNCFRYFGQNNYPENTLLSRVKYVILRIEPFKRLRYSEPVSSIKGVTEMRNASTMRGNYSGWIGALILAALVTLAAKYYAYFPGDVAVERFVQSMVPQNLTWAVGISRTAEFPWVVLILGIIAVFRGSWPDGAPRSFPSSASSEC